jgi:hypothetical protein
MNMSIGAQVQAYAESERLTSRPEVQGCSELVTTHYGVMKKTNRTKH